MFGLALSICPLASSGYDFTNRPKYTAYCPSCGFPGAENSPEASIVYILTKKTDDRKPVRLMDVRRMGCSARISKEFSSSLLKNKDPKQFFIKAFIVPLHVSNYCSKAPSEYNIVIAKITVLRIMA
jgi:hypothetical protein